MREKQAPTKDENGGGYEVENHRGGFNRGAAAVCAGQAHAYAQAGFYSGGTRGCGNGQGISREHGPAKKASDHGREVRKTDRGEREGAR